MSKAAWCTGYRSVNGFRQFFRDWAPSHADGPPVLALHGSLTQSGMWIALAERAASVRILCPDQRGFGLSEDPGGDSCAEFAADAVALAEQILPGRYVVMGHSFACSIALEVARIAAKESLGVVLVDPVVRTAATPAPPFVSPVESYGSLESAESHFRTTEEGSWPGEALRKFTQDVMVRDPKSGTWRMPYTAERLLRLRRFTSSEASDYNIFDKAKHVRCPVLIFRGGMSKRFRFEAEQPFMEAFSVRPKLVVCARSGHFPATTETDLVAGALKGFIVGLSK
ncbi:MAG TPA: alpha/beta hydrolase [Pseudolabrys sp.]|nr:alpha/beta hydrolase [Pseudolabrys sp.]